MILLLLYAAQTHCRTGANVFRMGIISSDTLFACPPDRGPLWKILGLTIIYTDMNICINRRVVKRYHAGFLSLN